MNRKPACYITYCQKDISQEKMELIVKCMEELCNNRVEILFDGNVKYADSFEEFEDKIFSVDAIFIFFSPNYKKRCLEEPDSGVAKEYRKILHICQENKKRQQKECSSYIRERTIFYPILFQGRKEVSITQDFIYNHYLDVSDVAKFCEDRNHKLSLTNNFLGRFSNSISEMLREISTSCIEKTDSYMIDYDNMLKELFINTKSEHINLPDELFIETAAYQSIIKQQKYITVGRKGSGKTTVKNTISTITGDKYKGIISIIADEFSIDETYNLLFLNEKVNSDIENNLSKIDTYKIIWNAFINLYCVFVVYKEYLINSLSHPEQVRHITSLEKTVIDIFKEKERIIRLEDEEVTKTIYSYVLTNLERFIDEIIRNGRNNLQYFQTDIKSYYTSDNYLRFLIGKATYEDFYYILRFCRKKIFITLDGFDVRYEFFKKTSVKINNEQVKKSRLEFENLWLMVFIETLIELKYNSKLKNIIDLCLTMPVDRIEAIKNYNRDFYKYHANTVALSWNSNDLVKLITRRLKYLNSISDKEIEDNSEGLDLIMNKVYPNIPQTIQLERNGYNSMPLFLYILRKSFWRPRDIIRYYGNILTLNQRKKSFNEISIKRAIKDEALRIIQDEFFGEFTNLYTNLRDIVELFNSKKQTLSYDELYDIIKNVPFVIECNKFENDFYKKVKILYMIGFLGINPTDEHIEEQFMYDKYAFVFTEGTSVLRILKSESVSRCKFVIHPIFTEYLFLKVDYDNLMCNYTWDYVDNINCSNIDYVMVEE